MKRIINYTVMAFATAMLVSCDLSEYNPNEASVQMAFGSERGVEMVAAGFYNNFPKCNKAYAQESGDVDYMPVVSLANKFRSDFDPDLLDEWGGWNNLRDINYFIDHVNSAVCTISKEKKEHYIGMGRMFRAYWYFKELRGYGDLPWYDHVILSANYDDMYKPRDSRDEIVNNIISDLDYAYEHMTNSSPDKTVADKWVAEFLKMQVCLFEASFRKYNPNCVKTSYTHYTVEKLYRLAADAANTIMESGKFKLASDYRDIFQNTVLDTDEVLLGVRVGGELSANQNHYYGYRNGKTFTRAFINTFLNADGTAYTSKADYATETFKNEFTGRDPRLSQIVAKPGYLFGNKVAVPELQNNTAPMGYWIIKFSMDEPLDDADDKIDNLNTNATPIFRYAEVLLSYAEAKAELGEMNSTIWANTIGKIRARAGITGSTLTALPTTVDSYLKANFYPDVTDPVIMEIRRERGCELCLEGQRDKDIIRWGCGKLLADLSWEGFNFEGGLDTPVDIDGNGTNDYFFTTKDQMEVEEQYQNIWVKVNQATGIQVKANGSKFQLWYKPLTQGRYWAADGHLALDPIPPVTISDYKNHGYTIAQNPGY